MNKNKNSIIYFIINKINLKFYIGSTVNLENRIDRHFNDLKFNYHHCLPLQRAWNKYGNENFVIFTISIKSTSRKHLFDIEQEFIDLLNPDYNTNKTASGGCSFRSKETREKISKGLIGRPCSKETREKLSKSNTGKKQSVEQINKMKASKTGVRVPKKFKPVLQYKNEVFICEHQSIIDAANQLNISRPNIIKCLKKLRNTAGGFQWKYKKNE